MSHFMVGVIIPSRIKNVEAKVEKLLAPYDENIEVEPYEKKCYCVGHQARMEARRQAEEKFSIDEIREAFGKEIREPYVEKLKKEDPSLTDDDMFGLLWGDEYIDAEWQKALKPYNDYEEEILNNNPLKDSPNPECDECNGTGVMKSTYNPKSKWDWYSFGGRYNGVINGNIERDEKGFNFGEEYRQASKNIAKVADLLTNEKEIRAIEDAAERRKADRERSRMPYAIVTPDGEWHQKGEMGWFGMATDVNADWDDVVMEILEKYKDHKIVGMDLHI